LALYADMLSWEEYNCIKTTIGKKAIPTVKLLTKDHKDKKEDGDWNSRFVIPASNFTAGFPHVGQRGIKTIIDKHKVNY
jgi:hypothetical protein